jgi:hypothetical protein
MFKDTRKAGSGKEEDWSDGIPEDIKLKFERIEVVQQLLNEMWILLMKIQEILGPFLQTVAREQFIFHMLNLPEPVGVHSLLGSDHVPLNFFETVQRPLSFGRYERGE